MDVSGQWREGRDRYSKGKRVGGPIARDAGIFPGRPREEGSGQRGGKGRIPVLATLFAGIAHQSGRNRLFKVDSVQRGRLRG
jgi:hypothetical protein